MRQVEFFATYIFLIDLIDQKNLVDLERSTYMALDVHYRWTDYYK